MPTVGIKRLGTVTSCAGVGAGTSVASVDIVDDVSVVELGGAGAGGSVGAGFGVVVGGGGIGVGVVGGGVGVGELLLPAPPPQAANDRDSISTTANLSNNLIHTIIITLIITLLIGLQIGKAEPLSNQYKN